MSANKESYDQLLVIFGASGDLTSRKLLPAFSELFSRGLLPDRFAILGAARSDFSDISFRRSRRQVLKGDRADEFLGKVTLRLGDGDHTTDLLRSVLFAGSVEFALVIEKSSALTGEFGFPQSNSITVGISHLYPPKESMFLKEFP